jgi:L-ascorbate metabolism protein UlaG (beta-lactamase superfamily)
MAIKYTYIGHGTHSLDIGGKKIIVDPFFNDNPSTKVSADSVKTDYILISHGHFDHIADAVSIARRSGATVISNFEIINWLQKQGVPESQLHAHHIGGGFNYDFGYVKLTIAHHGSALPDGGYGGNPAGFLITAEGKKIYLTCDTGLFDTMRLYGEEGIDLMVLPIGDNFTMGPDDALRAIKLVNPVMAVPSHYGTWPLIAQDANAWAKRVEAETDTKVHVLAPGGSLNVS